MLCEPHHTYIRTAVQHAGDLCALGKDNGATFAVIIKIKFIKV